MKQYISLFKLKFINGLQYRVAALAGISTQILFGLVYIMVYIAFYESNSNSSLPMPLPALVNYLWLNQAFFSLVYTWFKDNTFLDMIKKGNVAYDLCRPINFYFKWFFSFLASRLSNALLRFLPVLLFAYFLPSPYNFTFPSSITSFILFVLALILSSLLGIAFAMIYHIISFFTIDERGIMTLFMVIAEILAGGVVPIAFFPRFLKIITNMLPFRYICDFPFNLYSGIFSKNEIIYLFLLSIIWIIVLILVGYFISNKAIKKAVVQGG